MLLPLLLCMFLPVTHLLIPPDAASTEAPAAYLSSPTVPARGSGAAILTVEHAGRFAVTVESSQGTALQLVDQMAGPGTVSGRPGETDGRLDELLDRGRYKIRTFSHVEGKGEATLAVHPFQELNSQTIPLLVEFKPVDSSLGDFEQRSWWLDIDADRLVVIEAAGRNLTDLRLWKEGGWLVDAVPEKDRYEPLPGKPLQARRLAVRLPKGVYLLTAYGGLPVPWTEEGEAHPLHLRYGIPRLAEAGRKRFTTGPFGLDRWLVPAKANYFRLELPEALPASLRVGGFDGGKPFLEGRSTASISKKSRLPVAELTTGSSDKGYKIVTVRAMAGQPYRLQHFFESYVYQFHRGGRFWISSVHSGHPQDSVDATAIVERLPRPTGHYTPFLSQTVTVGRDKGWARRCNLVDELTLHLTVEDTGTYEVLSKGTEAMYRIEPFFATPPRDYKPPDFRPAGAGWDLDAGFYILTARPIKKGILEAALRHKGFLDAVWDLLKAEKVRERPVRPAVRFPETKLDYNHSYRIYLNRQPGVRAGFIVRPLPLALENALPLALLPEEEVTVPVSLSRAGRILAEGEDGTPLDISIDGVSWKESLSVGSGAYKVRVRQAGEDTIISALRFEPEELRSDAPLPRIPAGRLSPLPKFDVLSEKEAVFFDLPRQGEKTFLVRTDGPSFFRLESTGLLATEGTVRTRVVPALFRDRGSGTGRNFFVGQYLREGEYQFTIRTLDRSAGHLGVSLARAPVRNGGVLEQGVPSRATLAAGDGLVYEFDITEEGDYRLEATALGRVLNGRLEDGEGWPLTAPGTPMGYTGRGFTPGRYRIFLLPERMESRRVTIVEKVPDPVAFEGHGPHPLPLSVHVKHLWRESEKGEDRHPDRWDFTLPAQVEVDIALNSEMRADLLRKEGDGFVPAGKVFAGRPWSGKLDEGEYRLETVSSRRNDRVEYEVGVTPRALVDGQVRVVNAPGSISIAVGSSPFVDISSSGRFDVSARLRDGEGRIAASSDDRGDDWNFQIARRLAPGPYTLEVSPVGTSRASTQVHLRALREKKESPLAVPAELSVAVGEEVSVFPLDIPDRDGLLLLAVRSGGEVGVALENKDSVAGAYESVFRGSGKETHLLIPLGGDGERKDLRLLVWSADRTWRDVQLDGRYLSPTAVEERNAAGEGIAFLPVSGNGLPAGAVEIALSRPGFFTLDVGTGQDLWWSSRLREVMRPVGEGLLSADGDRLWIAGSSGENGRPGRVRIRRFFLPPGEETQLPLPAGKEILCDISDGGEGPLFAVARTMAGQPGVELVSRSVSGADVKASDTMAVAPGAAASLLPRGGSAALRLWQAGEGPGAKDVYVTYRRFPLPSEEMLQAGVTAGELEGGGSRRFALPRGWKRVRFVLASPAAALVEGSSGANRLLWAASGNVDEHMETDARTVTLVNSGARHAGFTVEVISMEESTPSLYLSSSRPFERRSPHSGTVRVRLDAGRSGGEGAVPQVRRLRTAGSVEEAVFISTEGNVRRGLDFVLTDEGGTLLMRHGAGLMLAWIDDENGSGEGLWGGLARGRAGTHRPPLMGPLSGEMKGMSVTAGANEALHLRTDVPVVSRLSVEGSVPRVAVYPAGARIDIPPATGTVEIWLRPAGQKELQGRMELTSSQVTSIGEGLGPEVILAPGQTRLFSFTVDREGKIGFGVRAEADVVNAVLMNGRGDHLQRGAVGMTSVEKGTYFLALEAPDRGEAVRARPALAGIEPPEKGPPADIVQEYLRMAEKEVQE